MSTGHQRLTQRERKGPKSLNRQDWPDEEANHSLEWPAPWLPVRSTLYEVRQLSSFLSLYPYPAPSRNTPTAPYAATRNSTPLMSDACITAFNAA